MRWEVPLIILVIVTQTCVIYVIHSGHKECYGSPHMKTTHADTCTMSFGRKDPNCPRCQELLAGAAPRKGWGQLKREQEAAFRNALRTHNCATRGCGSVCTFGDW